MIMYAMIIRIDYDSAEEKTTEIDNWARSIVPIDSFMMIKIEESNDTISLSYLKFCSPSENII